MVYFWVEFIRLKACPFWSRPGHGCVRTGWQLQIAGPDEIGYRAEPRASKSPQRRSRGCSPYGPLDGETKERAFSDARPVRAAEFFGEFRHGRSARRLAHGVPVLTTSGAPWPMVATCGCGWSVAPTVEGLTEGLGKRRHWIDATLTVMGEEGTRICTKEIRVAEYR